MTSLNKTRDTNMARVAPIVDAKETNNKPSANPNTAPAIRVMMAAPGIDSAVTAT